MPEKLEDVQLIVAIGMGYGGCVVEIIKGGADVAVDVEEYGGSLDDLFYEGEILPTDAGIYIFTGSTHGVPGSDEHPRYQGEFILNPPPYM